jgi:hypothetical protein
MRRRLRSVRPVRFLWAVAAAFALTLLLVRLM